ncbi:MAG: hypothetical protein ABIN48_06160 [Ginsengibacter sp.]
MIKKITFSLPPEAMEGASEVYLLGDFNNWNPENAPKMEKQKDGSFKTVAELETGKTYQYRFLRNDGQWVNDYNAQSYTNVDGLHVDNCVISVPVSKTDASKKSTASKATAPKKTVKGQAEAKAPAKVKAGSAAAKKSTGAVASKKAAPVKSTKNVSAKTTTTESKKSVKTAAKKTIAPKAKK